MRKRRELKKLRMSLVFSSLFRENWMICRIRIFLLLLF